MKFITDANVVSIAIDGSELIKCYGVPFQLLDTIFFLTPMLYDDLST